MSFPKMIDKKQNLCIGKAGLPFKKEIQFFSFG